MCNLYCVTFTGCHFLQFEAYFIVQWKYFGILKITNCLRRAVGTGGEMRLHSAQASGILMSIITFMYCLFAIQVKCRSLFADIT
jgi:hypothetical protein